MSDFLPAAGPAGEGGGHSRGVGALLKPWQKRSSVGEERWARTGAGVPLRQSGKWGSHQGALSRCSPNTCHGGRRLCHLRCGERGPSSSSVGLEPRQTQSLIPSPNVPILAAERAARWVGPPSRGAAGPSQACWGRAQGNAALSHFVPGVLNSIYSLTF